jgi:hypothetical protein
VSTGPKPLSKQRSPWVEIDSPIGELGGVMVRTFGRRVGDGVLYAIVAEEPAGWHLSISFRDARDQPTRYPRWDEITNARYTLCPDDIDMVMHLPPSGEYVAVHDTTFHLHEHPERE